MRILLVTGDQPWPGTSGGRLRDQMLFEASAKVGEVHLLCFPFLQPAQVSLLPDGAKAVSMPWRRTLGARATTRLFATLHGRLVFQEHLVRQGAVEILGETLGAINPDAVILASPLFEPFVRQAAQGGRRVFVDMTDLRSRLISAQLRDTRNPGRWIRALLDAVALRRAEAAAARGASEVWFAAGRDGDIFQSRQRVTTRVVPNTVDVERYAELRGQPADRRTFGFVGSFDYAPNRVAAERLLEGILPRVRQHAPDASLVLIGRAPPPALSALVARTPGATLYGDDPAPIHRLARAGILAAPLDVGAGTKYKLIEAASAGIPIVSTLVGLAGLAYRPDEEVVVAGTDAEFAVAILALWADDARARRLAEAALERTRHEYDRRVSVDALRAALLT